MDEVSSWTIPVTEIVKEEFTRYAFEIQLLLVIK